MNSSAELYQLSYFHFFTIDVMRLRYDGRETVMQMMKGVDGDIDIMEIWERLRLPKEEKIIRKIMDVAEPGGIGLALFDVVRSL